MAVQFLMKKNIQEINVSNYELMSYKILYCISFYLEEYKSTNDPSFKTKIEALIKKS